MGGQFEGEWIHVHLWLSPFAVHVKHLTLFVNQLYTNTKQEVFYLKKRAASNEDFTGSIFLGFLRGVVAFKERHFKCL